MKQQHDETDYDGMGNHGRFPPEREEPQQHNTGDLLMLIVCLCVPVIYLLTIG